GLAHSEALFRLPRSSLASDGSGVRTPAWGIFPRPGLDPDLPRCDPDRREPVSRTPLGHPRRHDRPVDPQPALGRHSWPGAGRRRIGPAAAACPRPFDLLDPRVRRSAEAPASAHASAKCPLALPAARAAAVVAMARGLDRDDRLIGAAVVVASVLPPR